MDVRIREQATIEIPQGFRSFVESALLRVQTQYPELRFKATAAGIEIASVPVGELNDLRKNVLYAVYREKIYAETLPLRQTLFKAVTTK